MSTSDDCESFGTYQTAELLGGDSIQTTYRLARAEGGPSFLLQAFDVRGDGRRVAARLEVERQTIAGVGTEPIVRIQDSGLSSDGRPFLVCEEPAGAPATSRMHLSLPIRSRLELFGSVCDAVHTAHSRGVLHLGLTPDHVRFVARAGRTHIEVHGFGIVRALGEHWRHPVNTSDEVAYASPELCEHPGEDIDRRADVYSLGWILYELLGGNRASVAGRPLPQQELQWIVDRAKAPERADRYATVRELRSDISRYLAREPVSAAPGAAIYRLRKFVLRNRTSVMAASLVGVSTLLVATIAFRGDERPSERLRPSAQPSESVIATRPMTRSQPVRVLTPEVKLEALGQEIPDSFTGVPSGVSELVFSNQTEAAVRAWREAIARLRKERGDLAPDTLMSILGLARYLVAIEDFEAAVPLAREGVRGAQRIFTSDRKETVIGIESLGKALVKTGHIAEGIAWLRTHERVTKRVLGKTSSEYYDARGALGKALLDAGRRKDAEPHLLAAAEGQLGLYGAGSPRVVRWQEALGTLRLEQGRSVDAIRWHRLARDARRKAHGVDDWGSVMSELHLARSLRSDVPTESQEALQIVREVLPRVRRAKVGSWQRSSTLHTVANILARNKQPNAGKVFDEALALGRLGTERRRGFLVLLNDYGNWLSGNGELEKGIALLSEALPALRDLHGPYHHNPTTTLLNLASSLMHANRRPDAKRLLDDALTLLRAAQPPARSALPFVAERVQMSVLEALAGIEQSAQRWRASRPHRRELLKLNTKVFGAQHLNTLVAMNQLGTSLSEPRDASREELLEAKQLFADCLPGLVRLQGATAANPMVTLQNLCNAVVGLRDISEGVKWNRILYQRQLRVPNIPQQALAHTAANLSVFLTEAKLYEECSRMADAALRHFGGRLPDAHPMVINVLKSKMYAAMGLKRFAEAVPVGERLYRAFQAGKGAPKQQVANSRAALSRALMEHAKSIRESDPKRAIEMLERVRELRRQNQRLFFSDAGLNRAFPVRDGKDARARVLDRLEATLNMLHELDPKPRYREELEAIKVLRKSL